MLAGASGVDAALLVVALDDGVMPQTREHLRVLEALGIPAGVVAVTKADAVPDERLAAASLEVRDLLAGGPYSDADIVQVSGLDGAGIDARLIAVRVVHPDIGSPARTARLYAETAALLNEAGARFPRPTLDPTSLIVRHEYYGGQYALYTQVAVAAAARAREAAGLELECTYTGKAFAAFLDDAASGALTGPALFWLTSSARSSSALAAVDGLDAMAYRALPREFHVYFEEEVQPLDRG